MRTSSALFIHYSTRVIGEFNVLFFGRRTYGRQSDIIDGTKNSSVLIVPCRSSTDVCWMISPVRLFKDLVAQFDSSRSQAKVTNVRVSVRHEG